MKNNPASVDRAESAKYVVVGTAGHIDHGKTALVYALTGTDTDRLPEEKQRGITIDLGFAALDLEDAAGGRLHVSLIDVPGHHAFVRNMLAGTGGIDCVMLVIAADEGVKAQTEEHLAICGLLGIERGLVVLTKSDAVSEERLQQTRERVAQFLEHTFLAGAPVIAVSALRGDGIAELKRVLAEVAAQVPQRSSEREVRLPLDRAFSIRGFGTVVTGTLQSGSIRAGETLEQHPVGRGLRVRGVQVHGQSRDAAVAPCRVALNLAGVDVAQIARGDTLTRPAALQTTHTVDVELTMLRGAPALKHGARVRVHAFTSDTLARILLFDQKDSGEAGSGLARLRLAKPLLLLPGDRVVLRQCSPAETIGGGRVLDASVPGRVRKADALQWLKALQRAEGEEQVRLRIARRGVEGMTLDGLVGETGSTPATLRGMLEHLTESGRLLACAGDAHWVTTENLAAAAESAAAVLTQAGSLSRAELRSKTGLNAAVFEVVGAHLIASGKYEAAGETMRVAGRSDELPEPKRRHLQAIENLYARAGLAAPLLSEVMQQTGAAPVVTRELITLLLRSRRLVRMGADDAFVHTTALEKLYADLRLHRGESFDVGRFKAFTGLTRKHAIPLLEHLDQVRVTRNSGGTRVVL